MIVKDIKFKYNYSFTSSLYTYIYMDYDKSKEDLEKYILDIVIKNNEFYTINSKTKSNSIHIIPIKKYYFGYIYSLFRFDIYKKLELTDINYLDSLFKNFCDNYGCNTKGYIISFDTKQHTKTIKNLLKLSTPN